MSVRYLRVATVSYSAIPVFSLPFAYKEEFVFVPSSQSVLPFFASLQFSPLP